MPPYTPPHQIAVRGYRSSLGCAGMKCYTGIYQNKGRSELSFSAGMKRVEIISRYFLI
jgi:hypothetical protein